MFKMNSVLSELEAKNKPIITAVCGIGKMGKSLVNQMLQLKGMHAGIIINRNVNKAKRVLTELKVSETDIVKTDNIKIAKESIEKGKFVISDDYTLPSRVSLVDAVVDATGNPVYGAKLSYESLKNSKNMIMLNVECDSTVGSYLNKLAKENGVIYTGADGDEPAAIIGLIEFAKSIGLEVLAAGKGKNNKIDRYATNEELAQEAKEKKLCEKSLTSFVDATNTMIELNAVSNATGFLPDVFGCHGIHANTDELIEKLRLKTEGGILNSYKTLDYVYGIAPGVYALVSTDSNETKEDMKYLGMGDGPNYLLYRPFHLCSLEVPRTIFSAVIEKQATINPIMGQISDTIAVAKRDIKAGEKIKGIGNDDCYGMLHEAKTALEKDYLPIGLIDEAAIANCDIKKDKIITRSMIDIDSKEIIYEMRSQIDKDLMR
ncbi:MAG: SAF domain-containing protein [Tissierellia bacterium]|nr:SAF domain-containing protein [Tissierellia bacterium]